MKSLNQELMSVYDFGVLQTFINSISTDEEQYHSMITIHNLILLSEFLDDFQAAVLIIETNEKTRRDIPQNNKYKGLNLDRNWNMLKRWDAMAGATLS